MGQAAAVDVSATDHAVDCRGLTKSFDRGTVRAVDEVSLAIRSNEFFTLLGPSGCGKTTMLRVVAGFETQDAGSVFVHGQKLDGLPPYRRPVNTVFQSYAVFPHLTVAENIAFGLEMRRRPRAEIATKVVEMTALVKLTGLEARRPNQLSGGQQQRVALARALANEPRVLLLDEPLAALDLKLRTEMQLELKRLQAELGITFVFVTHDQHEAMTMSDRIAVMRGGRVLQVGTPAEIYDRPASLFVADFVGETNLLPATRIGARRFRLANGGELDAADEGTGAAGIGDSVTLAIRPERAVLVAADGEGIPGTVEQLVYVGADTTYYLRLAAGLRFRLREQNREGSVVRLAPGDAVAVAVPPTAVRVLAE
jgi:spermidine/putrescine transport system ATP-binding protein